MAENKNAVLLYCDIIHTVEKLDDVTAGKLFKHYLRYINDLHPKTDELLVEISFEPIRQNLKRDLVKWEETSEVRSKAGKASAKKRKLEAFKKKTIQNRDVIDFNFEIEFCNSKLKEIHFNENNDDFDYWNECKHFLKAQQNPTNPTRVESVQQNPTNPTDSVNVSVTDNVNVSVINKLEERKLKFASSLEKYLDKYGKELLNDFHRYWTEKNDKGKKMRFEMEKVFDTSQRLVTWKNRQKNFSNNGRTKQRATADIGKDKKFGTL